MSALDASSKRIIKMCIVFRVEYFYDFLLLFKHFTHNLKAILREAPDCQINYFYSRY